MDAKLFNGTTIYQKTYCLQSTLFGLHIIASVHGNPSGTVIGSFASRPKIDTRVPHLFSWIFSRFHLFKKNKLLVTGETKWSLNSKEKTG